MKAEAPGHQVLLIEDNPGDARLIREMLAEDPATPFRLRCVDRLARGLEALALKDTGLVLLDLSLPDSHGLDTFSKVYAHSPKVPIIVLSGNDDQQLALYAVKSGAQDYLVKGKIDRELLLRAMQYSIERKRYQEELERQANFDALTGLPNRHLLHDRLRQAVFAQRNVRSVAVVFMDLDHFKVINDSLGHNFGDEVLRHVGERLESAVREGDTVARLGGDEFVLILNDQTREDMIFRTMRRLIARVSEPVQVGGRELHITASAGISLFPQDGPDVQTLLKNADTAMYRAKSQGRNTFQFFTAEMNELANERLSMEQSLRRAIERDELRLHYQPRVSLATGKVDGVEALVRWEHPERGLIVPDRFIPLAEETGLIVPIGEWVLRRACEQGARWRAAGHPRLVVSVNLSARQLWVGGLTRLVGEVLAQTGMAGHLELELTESMVMHDVENVIATLQSLRDLGVRLSVDDFGTGYSSLSYLRRLPLNALKIDGSFVRDISATGGPDDGILARAIISLGHSLHLQVVAEGVEYEAQRDFLRDNGCDEMQGYFFAKPLPAAECEALF
ncbi:MAG TPA: EAL domain-containing protein [Usitatibacter sp.]|nr:EAL domain-containing protein [Usitatibacter sp.]